MTTRVVLVAGMCGALAAAVPNAFAGKPGGGGTPPSNPEILYVQNSTYDGTNSGDLYVMDADGANQRVVWRGLDGHAEWLYDGVAVTDPMKRPIVYGGNASEGYGVWRILADGTGRTLLFDTDFWVFRVSSSPVAAPDGERKLALEGVTAAGENEILVCDLDGSEPVWVTGTAGVWERSPRWSPEADRLVFSRPVAAGSQTHDICVASLTASGGTLSVGAELNLTAAASESFQQPDWSRAPGSSRIAARMGPDSGLGGEIVILDVANPGAAPVVLTGGAADPPNARQPSWAPDDSRLVYNGSSTEYPTGALWTVTFPGAVNSVLVSRTGRSKGGAYPANRTCPVWRRR